MTGAAQSGRPREGVHTDPSFPLLVLPPLLKGSLNDEVLDCRLIVVQNNKRSQTLDTKPYLSAILMGVDLPQKPAAGWPQLPAPGASGSALIDELLGPDDEEGIDEEGRWMSLRYNWGGWRELLANLVAWGHAELVQRLPSGNDGELISKQDCEVIATALEQHPYNLMSPTGTTVYDDIDIDHGLPVSPSPHLRQSPLLHPVHQCAIHVAPLDVSC